MKKIIVNVILIILILYTFSFENFASEIVKNTEVITYSEPEESDINDLTIYSNCILMIEEDSGDVLYERNGYDQMYPASTTKILTAVIVLEHCDLDEIVTVNSTAIKAVPSSYTVANLQIGEKLSVEDLLYTMLIPSANDAANALAEHVSGSISAFAELMNEKAKELGCTNSHFVNPNGVHDENHYTTAYDLALIAKYAMTFDTFRTIVTTTSYTLPSTDVYPYTDRTFTLSNSMLKESYTNYYYEYATGIKTGYTNSSQDCLVASAKKNNIEFIIVVLGAGYTESGLRQKYLDCKTLFDFAFDNYTTYYQELQQEKILKLQEEPVALSEEVSENTTNYEFLRGLSKIIAVIAIILAIRLLFKRKKRKKNNNYRKGKRRKAKHYY